MISYVDRVIKLAGRLAPIDGFAVWFRTPAGLFATFDEARDHCVALVGTPDDTVLHIDHEECGVRPVLQCGHVSPPTLDSRVPCGTARPTIRIYRC